MIKPFCTLLGVLVTRLPALIGARRPYTLATTAQRPPADETPSASRHPILGRAMQRLTGRSIWIRHLDTGSSNGSNLSIAALESPVYDFERKGFHIVASPRHADLLLVTGPMTYNLAAAAEATFEAMPQHPRAIVTVGDDTNGGGIYAGAYGILGRLPNKDMQAARIGHVSGPVPRPAEIFDALCSLADRSDGAAEDRA